VSGIPTAWVATWGSGKPVIALGSDIDGIPQASQKPGVAYPDPIVDGRAGTRRGHNTGMPLNIVAALAVKKIMERDKLPGTLMLWPGVAEEQLASKAWYVRDGMFKDVDVNLFTHVGNNLGVSWGEAAAPAWSHRVHLRGRDGAQRGRAVARPLGARRGRADERGLAVPPRAPAAVAALALRHHQRRRPAERRPAQRQRLVLLPRESISRT
jgi:metal-dependent amidase/aminoacylase/carboxypeptidase family protein